jgi:hypothetical protein
MPFGPPPKSELEKAATNCQFEQFSAADLQSHHQAYYGEQSFRYWLISCGNYRLFSIPTQREILNNYDTAQPVDLPLSTC